MQQLEGGTIPADYVNVIQNGGTLTLNGNSLIRSAAGNFPASQDPNPWQWNGSSYQVYG
jgi:hypothetical protein